MITLLYSLGIAYTVGSLSIILFVLSVGLYTKWETKKRLEKFHEMLKAKKPDCPGEDW